MKRILSSVLSVAFVLVACATTREVALKNTSATPAAQGSVTARSGSNGNNQVDVRVKHLAEPGAVTPGTSAYVVWVQPALGEPRPQNMGVLRVDKNLTGLLSVKVPYDNFLVFVSAEPSGMVTSPSGARILTTEKNIELAH